MDIIRRLLSFRPKTDEYWDRFMQPKVDWAREAGMPEDVLDGFVRRAIKEADGITYFPGVILRDLIDAWINESAD